MTHKEFLEAMRRQTRWPADAGPRDAFERALQACVDAKAEIG